MSEQENTDPNNEIPGDDGRPAEPPDTAAEGDTPEAAVETGDAAGAEPAPEPAEAPPEPDEPAEPPPDPADEIAALNDKLLRVLADGENQRRRAQKEREDTSKYAIAGFARDMLAVADNLSRALASLPEAAAESDESFSGFIDGVQLTWRELASILERHGIKTVEPMGQKFDHELHQAMFEIPTADAAPGTVVQVLEIGYVLNDRLLRAAKVAVARAQPEPDETERVDTTV